MNGIQLGTHLYAHGVFLVRGGLAPWNPPAPPQQPPQPLLTP